MFADDLCVPTDSSEDEGDLQWLKTFQQDYVEVAELARSVNLFDFAVAIFFLI